MVRTNFYFDTSAINELANDPLRDLLVGALTAPGNVVFVSVLNVYELAATKDPTKRLSLLRLAKRIAKNTRLLTFPQEVLRRSLDAFAADRSTMDATLDYDSTNIWIAFEHPEQVNEQARADIRAQNVADEKWFREMHGGARDPMRASLPPHQRPRTATRLMKLYFSRQDFVEAALRSIVSGFNHPELVGREYEILQRVEPWKFFYAAFVASIFHRAIKDEGFGHSENAGSTDTQQATYVTTCDVFVTHDAPQLVSLRPLGRLAHKPRRIRRYREIRGDLLVGRY